MTMEVHDVLPSPELRCLSEAEKSEARKCLVAKDGCCLRLAGNVKR